MTCTREETRSEMRRRRALAASTVIRKTDTACARTANTVNRARIVLADPAFTEILRTQGVQALPRLLTAKEAAACVQCHPNTIYQAVKSGALRSRGFGRMLRFTIADLDAWTKGQR